MQKTGKTLQRRGVGSRISPDVRRAVELLAVKGSTYKRIQEHLYEHFPEALHPSERTIYDLMREAKQKAGSVRDGFLFTDESIDPGDARLVMDLLAQHEQLRIDNGVVPRRPPAEVLKILIRIRRAYPLMPVFAAADYAYQYHLNREDRPAQQRLDYELALWALTQEDEEADR